MDIRPVLREPPLGRRPGQAVALAAWQAAILAVGLAGLFVLVLRSLGA